MHVSGITSIYQLSSSTCNITVGEANSLSTSVPTTSHAVTPVTEGSKPNSHNLMPVGLNWSVCLHYLRDSVSANAHARCISACGQRITHCDLVKVSVQSCLWWHLLMWSFLDDGIILKFYQKSQKRKRDPCSTVIKPMVNSNRTMTIYWGISAAASLHAEAPHAWWLFINIWPPSVWPRSLDCHVSRSTPSSRQPTTSITTLESKRPQQQHGWWITCAGLCGLHHATEFAINEVSWKQTAFLLFYDWARVGI